MAARRSPQGSGPKSGATNPQAPAPAYSDRLSQLEKYVDEIRDGTVKGVLEKLRRLSYEIEDTNIMFDSFDRTGRTLDDFRVKVDHYEAENGKFEKTGRVRLGTFAPTEQAGEKR